MLASCPSAPTVPWVPANQIYGLTARYQLSSPGGGGVFWDVEYWSACTGVDCSCPLSARQKSMLSVAIPMASHNLGDELIVFSNFFSSRWRKRTCLVGSLFAMAARLVELPRATHRRATGYHPEVSDAWGSTWGSSIGG